MSVLVARIPEPQDRCLDILHNVLEEHGDLNADAFHATTFQKFLESIASPTNVSELFLDPAVRAFNSVLTTACTFDELEVGISCMGIIEMAFADISAIIGKSVVERGWVKPDALVHYKLHAEIDHRHAEEFFRVVERVWDQPERRASI